MKQKGLIKRGVILLGRVGWLENRKKKKKKREQRNVNFFFCGSNFHLSGPEPLPTGMASDLHARGIYLSGGSFLDPLGALNLFSRTLPHLARTCELRLRHLHLAPGELPHPLRVGFLHRGEADLLRGLPLECLHAVAHQHGRRRPHADGELQVERGGTAAASAAVCGGGGGDRRAEAEEGGVGARRWQKVEFSVDFVFH